MICCARATPGRHKGHFLLKRPSINRYGGLKQKTNVLGRVSDAPFLVAIAGKVAQFGEVLVSPPVPSFVRVQLRPLERAPKPPVLQDGSVADAVGERRCNQRLYI